MNLLDKLKINHRPRSGALDLLKYIGPGLLVTVGFIDPGNWATNLAAGSEFGYALLWVVTFSSVMLIIIQHNVAHLGIVTGLCLSEATNKYMPRVLSRPILGSAMLASVSTSLAEILGGAIALRMLFGMPIKAGAVIVTIVCLAMLFSNTYSKTERWIITFVSIIGLSFLYELALVDVDWGQAVVGWVKPTFPQNSMLIIMSVLGAVVMPHNLFLHSEVIQSREWNLEDESVIKKQLKYEFYDTLLSMVIGWAINSAMIILAASTFFKQNIAVDELDQAQQLLVPLVGNNAGVIFAAALLLAGTIRYRRGFHLRRILWRGVQSYRPPLKAGSPAIVRPRLGHHIPDRRSVQGIDPVADVVERAIADHGLHASVPDLQQEGHGRLREQPLYDHPPLAVGNDGNRPKYSPAHQPILKRNRYLCPIRRKTINF